ncbi:MAG: hypothetical protein KAS71_12420 [Bacteroidales bacterium]|nr:hypothetical protein [Bacteroidales bacterium]
MKSKNMILPAEKFDFMKWFVNKARKTNNYRDVKIEDYHFIEYHEERMMGMNKSAKWVEFYNELSDAGYISTNVEIFDYVMKHKRRPSDKDKIQWLTFKADALDIRSQFGFSMKKFNNCFVSKDGRPFTLGSQTDYNPERNKELSTIIKKYKLIS